MKKLILFFSCMIFYSQMAQSQEVEKITIQFSEQTIESALHKLEQESEFRFVFQDKITCEIVIANVRFEQINTFQILDSLLAGTGYDFAVAPNGKYSYWVIIYKIYENIINYFPVLISVEGRVTGFQEEPVLGATLSLIKKGKGNTITQKNIVIDNNSILAVANIDGNFFIPSVDKNAQILVKRFGYLPQVVRAKDAKLINLEPDPIEISIRVGKL